MKRLALKPEFAAGVLLLLTLALGGVMNRSFWDVHYLLDAGTLHCETALMALGMTLVIVCAQIDLSPAANLALVGCLVCRFSPPGQSAIVVLLLAVGLGAAFGAVNGLLVAYGRLPSFLVTLGTMALYRGAAQAISASDSFPSPASLGRLDSIRLAAGPIAVPVPVLIACVFALLVGLLLHGSIFGRWIYAVGINEEAAVYSAVPTKRVQFWCFTLLGALCGLAAMLMVSRLGVARYNLANGQELDVITAVVLGGTAIFGGRGSIVGTMLAVALVAAARTAMGLADVTAEYQLAVIGSLMIVAVLASGGLGRFAQRISSVRKT